MHPGDLDSTDRKLLHALQIEPRASWKSLERVVGVNSSTLARRWARLSDEGLAWVTGHPQGGQSALVEIESELTQIPKVTQALMAEPYVQTIELCSGARSILALINAPDMVALSEFLTDRLGRIAAIKTAHSHVSSEIYVDGSSWRLRELSQEELSRMPPPPSPRPRAARHVPPELKAAIFEEVWRDGRVPVAVIAERHGVSPQRVADAIATLRRDDALRFRTDIARNATEWTTQAWYFIEAPSTLRDAIRHTVDSVPEIRFAMTTASRANLVLVVWLRHLGDVHKFETMLESALRGARVVDRSVVLRAVKHLNRRLGPATAAVDQVGSPPSITGRR